ncbi:MAG TPA: DUF2844 domain-containing protein [Myxococcales bacterium]|nr:DUF2844 domain-containing protein [Myxococcales bacterium]
MRIRRFSAFCLPAVAAVLLGLPRHARATLGGNLTTVKTDQSRMKASLQVSSGDQYAVHEMKAATGTTVREYATPDGKIFAVAWQGPWRPDMRQLLGEYFTDYQEAAKGKRTGHSGPLASATDRVVIESSGRPRAFRGRAWVPDLVPAGVDPAEIR